MARTKLIDNDADLMAACSAVNDDLDYTVVQSYIFDAEATYIIPAIGYPMYNKLLGDALSTPLTWVLTLLQKASANLMLANYAAIGAVQISNAGIQVLKNSDRLPASDKKIYQLKRLCYSDGFRMIEQAVNFMEDNRASFAEYINDAAHNNNRSLYTNTTAEFSTGYDLRGNAELFQLLKPSIRTVEENQIDPILGSDVSIALRAAILAKTVSPNQRLLLSKINRVSACLAIAEAIPWRLVSFDANGFAMTGIATNTDNMETGASLDDKRAQSIMNSALSRGSSELSKLTTWLNANASLFTGYTVKGLGSMDTINDADGGIFFV